MSMTAASQPLKGDGQGHYRVHIVGNSGVGKSTLGKELASTLGVPFIPLDTIFWMPDWQERPRDEFKVAVADVLSSAEAEGGWIVDGNFVNALDGLIGTMATDVVWLDPPFALYFPRIMWRTLMRLLRIDPPCSPGCEESWKQVFFSRDSILWWCITQHSVVRTRNQKLMAADTTSAGGPGRMIRLGGWGEAQANWLRAVKEMVRTK